jgi:serine/threonine protein kinase
MAEMQALEDDIQRHTTLQYRAPEMIDVYQKRPVNEKADIWAMGVLLYKLCFYTTPFEEHGQLAILNARYTMPSSPPFSEGICRLIMSMLQEDQSRRPTVHQVMQTVCQLRGTECPIRDVYSVQVSPSFSSPVKKDIFEKVSNVSQQKLPDIKPMRRGRPTSSTASSPATLPARSPEPASLKKETDYDPFDTSHFSGKPAKTTPSSPASFQNNFTTSDSAPSNIPITVHATPLPQLATRVQTQNKAIINKKVSSDIEARFNAIKSVATKPAKPAPPPKPARFRSNQIEFKEKFPSVEELKKSLPS